MGRSYTMGVNMWTDLSQEEWEQTHLGYRRIAMVNTSRGQDTHRYTRPEPGGVGADSPGIHGQDANRYIEAR